MFRITRPTEFADLLVYMATYSPNFPAEDACSNASVFAEAFAALALFEANSPTEDGKEAVRQCDRNLRVAFEHFEHGDDRNGSQLVQETEGLFRKARKFIRISDA